MKSRLLLVILLLALFAACAQAQIPVTDDAFTSSATPNANYGVSLGLVVQSPTAAGVMASPAELSGFTANTYLKFDLSALPPNVTAGNLSKANLRLYVDFVVSPGTFDVYQAAGSWNEGTLTASNAPGIVGAPINQSPISVTKALKYIDIDITSAFANGPPVNGLVLVPSKGSPIFVSFDSKENLITSHDPELSISVNDASSLQLQQEITRATQAENTISTNLSNEVVRAENAENSLTNGLNAEIKNRIAGDAATLTSANTFTNNSILSEAAMRIAGDTALQQSLNSLQSSLSGYAQLSSANTFTASQTISGDLSANNLNAAGEITAGGGALLSAVQQASASQGYPSSPLDLAASVSDGTAAHNETFRWQSVPINNGTPNFAAQLDLLYGGGVTPSPTGFSFNPDGTLNFVPTQKFAGDGSGLKNVMAVSALTSNSATTAATANNALQLNGQPASAYAQLAQNNTFSGTQTIQGNISISGAGNGIMFGDGSVQTTAASALSGGQNACFASGATPNCSLVISSSATPPGGYFPLTSGSVSVNSWSAIASFFQSLDAFGAAAASNGKIYVVGGLNSSSSPVDTIQIYDPTTNKWTEGTAIPNPGFAINNRESRTLKRDSLVAAAIDGPSGPIIYAIGGYANTGLPGETNPAFELGNAIPQAYDTSAPKGQEWTKAGPAVARAELAAATINGKVYILGGLGKSTQLIGNPILTLPTAEVFDPATGTTSLPDMPTPRAGLTAAALNGKIYAIGGYTIETDNTGKITAPKDQAVVEVYDPNTNSWGTAASLPRALPYAAATTLNGLIYLIGGESNQVLTYDPNADRWTPQSPIPSVSGQTHDKYLGAVTSAVGQIYALGGGYAGRGNPGGVSENDRYTGTQTAYTYVRVCSTPGQTICDFACTNTSSDPANCGNCGNACLQPANSTAVCSSGSCAGYNCNTGYSQCSNSCVDLQADPNNCGSCGTVCSGTTPNCVSGACACGAPNLSCSGACVNAQIDNNNCGACGNVCNTAAAQFCQSGSCVCFGLVCNGACTDSSTDNNNCGACGNVCNTAAGQICSFGSCLLASGVTCTANLQCASRVCLENPATGTAACQ